VVDYKECGGWGCCYNNFFEVWKKTTPTFEGVKQTF